MVSLVEYARRECVIGLVGLTLIGAGVSWALTGGVRRYTLARSILDIPNARSSHTVPTPRGGGFAIAVVTIAGIALMGVVGVLPARWAVALAGGGTGIAAIGWIDDYRSAPASVRALVQSLAATWALGWLGGMPSLNVGTATLYLGPAGFLLALVGIVWAVNLFNFMDGIDGIAAGQAASAGALSGAVLLWQGQSALAATAWLIAAASAGFLGWNWAPARIFMGDVGSSLLGFLFGVLAVISERADAIPLLAWVLLLGVFVFDATVTLLRRVRCGERWHEAHRSHAYQRAVDGGLSHAAVSSVVMGTTVVLGGLVALGVGRPAVLPLCLLAGMVLLVSLYVAVERYNPMKCR